MCRAEATTEHGRLFMSIVHAATANTRNRPSNQLNVRQRLVIQRLGLDGPTNPSVLGKELGIVPSSITVVADRLEALGQIERVSKPGDRRAVLLQLTSQGETTFAAEIGFYQSIINETLATIDNTAADEVLDALAALDPLANQADTA